MGVNAPNDSIEVMLKGVFAPLLFINNNNIIKFKGAIAPSFILHFDIEILL